MKQLGSVKQKAKDPSMPRGVIDIRPDSSELSLDFHLHVISFHIYNVDDVYNFNDMTVFFLKKVKIGFMSMKLPRLPSLWLWVMKLNIYKIIK